MQLFYSTNIINDLITLDENDSKHAIKVLRMHEGDQLMVVDGKGTMYKCEIIQAHPKKCLLSIQNKNFTENPYSNINIAIAPTKNINRFEWFLEKATEIGVGKVYPIVTANSERKEIKTDRLEKVVVAAMKQSLKSYLPSIEPICSFNDFLKQNLKGNLLMAHCNDNFDQSIILEKIDPKQSTIILIGPEGDFNENEINKAIDKGYLSVTLGNARLRTETAAIVATTLINQQYA